MNTNGSTKEMFAYKKNICRIYVSLCGPFLYSKITPVLVKES
jgi:hypothetical protein